jgi:hypothetical protein|tara:strand:+ start:697 stop:1560 length:864 start_codon:yes stop_codon:yes gene_type:complete
MASMITNANDFKPSENMIYTKPKVNSVGGKSVGIINSMSKKSLLLQTPLMMNWGVNVYDNPNGNSYDFSLQFPRDEFSDTSSKTLLKMLQDFEDKIKNDASTNAREWFGKATMSSEVIDALWSPMLKYPKDQSTGEPDKSRSPTLKVKLPVWENEFKFELFDVEHNTLIPNEDKNGPDVFIQKGSNVACILQCGGIWFANGKFGVTWKLYQGVVKQVETLSKGQCHISDDVLKCESSETSSPKPLTTYDSDGEEETQEETQEEPQEETQEEPQPEPEKKTKPKKSKK